VSDRFIGTEVFPERRPGIAPTGAFKPEPAGSDRHLRSVVSVIIAALLSAVAAHAISAQPRAFTPREESPEEFAAGSGRDETFYTCTACHNFNLVAQQGMSRRQWDETITLMNEKHNMPKLDDKEREVVLNYLEAAYPPRVQERGWQNPFLNR
jgi:mono/diheme cytochrome c family protein